MAQSELYPPFTNDYREIQAKKDAFQGPFHLSVSIVIPFYKDFSVLARTLASLVHQTYPAHLIEVIIADDGSPEPVMALLKPFRSDLNLQYVRQEDLGFRISSVRNLAIRHARGDVILSLDFDMICPPTFVENHLKWFHVSDRVATIGPRRFIEASSISIEDILTNFQKLSKLPASKGRRSFDVRLLFVEDFYTNPLPERFFFGCNVGYWRKDAVAIGGWDEAYDFYFGYEDYDFGYRLWLSGCFLALDAKAFAFHQDNEVVSLDSIRQGNDVNRARFFQKFPEVLKNWDVLTPTLVSRQKKQAEAERLLCEPSSEE